MMQIEAGEVLVSREQIADRVAELGAQISEKYRGEELVVVCVLTGAMVFMTDLVRKIDPSVHVMLGFIKASSYGASTVSSGNVRITVPLSLHVAGKHVLIVEDIVDSGFTLAKLREYFLGLHVKSLEICTLLDKKERRQVDVPVDYVGLQIPNEFVVGYGLDYDGLMRNLPDIHKAKLISA